MFAYYSIAGLILEGFIAAFLLASPAKGQDLRDVKISVNAERITLEQVFQLIEKKTNFKFLYNEQQIPINEIATMEVENKALYDILITFAKEYGLTFNRINNQIIVKKNEGETEDIVTAIESGSVKGYVTDIQTKEALAGATISFKGTTIGTYSNSKGYYEISNIKPGKYTVAVSYVGYSPISEEIEIASNKTIRKDFYLNQSVVDLDEVTVTSTISAKLKRSVATTTAEIRGYDIQTRDVANVTSVLESVPGIIITAEGANSNGTSNFPSFFLRGTSALLNSPIKYLLDGVEVSSSTASTSVFNTLNPNDIEKIEVLKGPMSSSLYGSGSANGIIAITTKKGKAGKTRINFRSMFAQQKDEYADRSSFSQNYSLNISGGSESLSYLTGVNYTYYPTTTMTDYNNGMNNNTWSYSAKLSGKINNIKADVNVQYGQSKYGSSSNVHSDSIYYASIGYPSISGTTTVDNTVYNYNFLYSSLHLTHILADNWYHELTAGYNNTDYNYNTYSGSSSFEDYSSIMTKKDVRYFMFYSQDWSKQFNTNLTAGFEWNYTLQTITDMYTTIARTDNTTLKSTSATLKYIPYNSRGYFAEMVNSYDNKLFLTTGIRFENNDNYAENMPNYAMPRVGLTYVMSFGDFNIKTRATWGVSSEAPDPSVKVGSVTKYSTYTSILLANKDIKPQRGEGYEFGADFFYTDNYSLTVTYYDQRIKDMIRYISWVDPSDATLYYAEYVNVAEGINRGVEISTKALYNRFALEASFTATTSKYGDNVGKVSTVIYPGAPCLGIPKNTLFTRLSYMFPSFLPWTEKGGKIIFEYRHNGNAYQQNAIKYAIDWEKWKAAGSPAASKPASVDYYGWMPGWGYFNLRGDLAVTDYANLYCDISNLFNKHGSVNSWRLSRFPGRRISLGFSINY